MSKIRVILIVFIIAIVTFTACGGDTAEPVLLIKFNDEVFNVIHYGDFYNNTQDDIEKRLKEYMIGMRFEDLPIISFDQEIVLNSDNFDVDEYQVYDYILDNKANIISDFDMQGSLVEEHENDKASFKFIDVIETRKYEDYDVDNKTVHCLVIKCKIDKSDFVFAILVLEN